jgi:ABC-2 type transport system ATP-binding protein
MEGLALDVRDVTKTFPRGGLLGLLGPRRERERIVALAGVNLAVRRGEIFGLLGPNGSGKSTLVRLVATLLLPDSGQITVFGHDAQREPRAVRRLINRVSADAAFFKGLTAMENLLFTARLYGLSGTDGPPAGLRDPGSARAGWPEPPSPTGAALPGDPAEGRDRPGLPHRAGPPAPR